MKRKRQLQYSSPLTMADKVLHQLGNMLIQPNVHRPEMVFNPKRKKKEREIGNMFKTKDGKKEN